MAKSANQET